MEYCLLSVDICEKPPVVEHANEIFNIEPNVGGRYAVGTVLTITCDDIFIQSGHTTVADPAAG